MTASKQDWTWVGTERVQAIHRLAKWTLPTTSLAAVLVVVACFAPAVAPELGQSSSLVTTFVLMTVVCLVFAAVTARALPQIAAASSLDAWRARRFVGFSIILCVTSWLFGVFLAGATSLVRATSLLPLAAGLLGSILLTAMTAQIIQLGRTGVSQRS